MTTPLCACGCGEPVNQRYGRWNKYVWQHAARVQPLGEQSHRWRGGEFRDGGYVYVQCPGHPRAVQKGSRRAYVRRCVLVAEQKLGRLLKSGEVVHHLNRQRDDDRPENIEVFASQAAHLAEHNRLLHAGRGSRVEFNWVTLCKDSPVVGLTPDTLAHRVKVAGWTLERALTTPLRKRHQGTSSGAK